MGPWNRINEGTIPVDALVVYYVPRSNYVWASGNDRDEVVKQYPTVSHYRVVTEAPAE